MQFYDVETAYKLFRKEYGYKDPAIFYKDVYQDYLSFMKGNKNPRFYFVPYISFPAIISEQCWYQERMPYYKIWAGVFDTFIKTRIDIKARLLKFPHQTFSILLPKTKEGLLTFDFNGKLATVQSITVIGDSTEATKEEGFVGISLRVIYRVDDPANEYKYPGSFLKTVRMPIDDTIENGINRDGYTDQTHNGEDYLIPHFIMDACVRLVVATIFLATGSHKVLEYDVLAKHLNAYREEREANSKKRKSYENKAKQKGKFGWNIGSGRGNRGLKLPNGTSYAKACQDAGGREHLYQHVRGGHWHTVKYGKGRQEIKVVWFEETTVRKDLPPKPIISS
jgi:hypothetical protein